MTNIYIIQAYEKIMWGCFCITIIDFIFTSKSLLNLFSTSENGKSEGRLGRYRTYLERLVLGIHKYTNISIYGYSFLSLQIGKFHINKMFYHALVNNGKKIVSGYKRERMKRMNIPMIKIYCVERNYCGKFVNGKTYILNKALVISIICSKCRHNNDRIFKK